MVRFFSVVLVACLAMRARGDDWPQWQGPDRTAVSHERGLLQDWPAGGPPLAWRVEDLGGGDSAPAIVGGVLYGMSNRDGQEIVWARAEQDGHEIWATSLGDAVAQRMPQSKEGPGGTPTVDGDRLYVVGMGGRVACLARDTGGIVWQRSFVEDFAGSVPAWSYRESPLVDGQRLICVPGGPKALVAALDTRTGETPWTTARPQPPAAPASEQPPPAAREGEQPPPPTTPDARSTPDAPAGTTASGTTTSGTTPERSWGRGRGRGRGFGGDRSGAGYASCIAIEAAGCRQYVAFTASALIGVDAKDGTLLWHYAAPANGMGITCSTPIFADGLVFAASAYGTGGGAVKLSASDDGGVAAEQVYFSPRMQNHHGGMIVIDGALYGAHGGNEGGFMTCLDFQTGEVLWRDREGPKGALAMADGRLYLRSEKGEMVLIEPSREGLLVRGRFEQPDRRSPPAWAHPVIANGRLYIRDQDLLLCYNVAAHDKTP